jgi:hypothetical protein
MPYRLSLGTANFAIFKMNSMLACSQKRNMHTAYLLISVLSTRMQKAPTSFYISPLCDVHVQEMLRKVSDRWFCFVCPGIGADCWRWAHRSRCCHSSKPTRPQELAADRPGNIFTPPNTVVRLVTPPISNDNPADEPNQGPP